MCRVLSGVLSLFVLSVAMTAQGTEVKIDNTYTFVGGTFSWRIFINAGPDVLARISCVEYTLDPAFRDPIRRVCDGSDSFALQEKGPTEFKILIKIEWRDGAATFQSYTLDLHSSARGRSAAPTVPLVVHDPALKDVKPIALAYLTSGMLVLDAWGVRLLQARSGGFLSVADLSEYRSFTPIGLAAALINGGDVAWIVFVSSSGALSQGQVAEYVGPTKQRSWLSPGPVSVFNGVAVDSHRAIVYLAKYANDTFSLYELGLQEDGHAHLKDILDWSMPPFGNSVDRDIGPMAVDASQSVLFAADRLAGDLYRVNLLDLNDHRKLHLRDSHGHTRDSLGSPSALAIDSTGRTLYVADNKRLWVVRLNTDPAQVEGPWQPYQFHQLSAVAVDNNNNVWVGDQGEHTIHVLSSAGILMRTFRY